MKLVIDIDEDLYAHIKNSCIVCEETLTGKTFLGAVYNAIANGKLLPKGHGDLIDRNELKKVYDERITYLYALNRKDNPSREAKICATNWCSNTIDELPTIIEADKGE